MPGGAVHKFDDPYPYQAAIRAADIEVLPTTKGRFQAELTQIDFNKLWMQHCQESLPRIFRGATRRLRASIGFLLESDQPEIRHCGIEVSYGDIIANDGQSMHRRTFSPTRWGSMSLTPEDLAEAGHVIAGLELTAPSHTCVIRPDTADMQRLLRLFQEAVALSRIAPDRLCCPEVARALEQALVYTLVTCLTSGTRSAMSAGDHRHSAAVTRFEDFIDANADRPLYIEEVCAASGVSERTLRASCQDHLGMSPVRYLWLRRMHLARRKLMMADPSATTVTEIATEHGFWELGRFSVQYQSLFGESPSSTLKGPASRFSEFA